MSPRVPPNTNLNLPPSITTLQSTETIIPPLPQPTITPFPSHQYPTKPTSTSTLLIIPTRNTFKTALLNQTFESKIPTNQTLHTLTIPSISGVGEQPYNSAGLQGAHNRITAALQHLSLPENQGLFHEHDIGAVVVATIENFIQLENIARPTDFGVVVLHNATTGETEACFSEGVTVPMKYVERARRAGFEGGNEDFGAVTVGSVFAKCVEGVDQADWHRVVVGRSRYDILTEAVRGLDIRRLLGAS